MITCCAAKAKPSLSRLTPIITVKIAESLQGSGRVSSIDPGYGESAAASTFTVFIELMLLPFFSKHLKVALFLASGSHVNIIIVNSLLRPNVPLQVLASRHHCHQLALIPIHCQLLQPAIANKLVDGRICS